MLTDWNYAIAWLVYLIAGAGFLLMVWIASRRWRWLWLRDSVRAVFAVLVLTPWYAHPDQSYMAPAVVTASFELVFESAQGALRAAVPLLAATLGALGLVVLERLLRWALR